MNDPKPSKKRTKLSKKYLRERWQSFLSQDKNGVLLVEGISVREIERKYGTPVYIIVESEIRRRLRDFKNAFPYFKLRPQYSSKTNTNLEILRIAREEGFELDASSVGEVILGLLADYEPSQITYVNLYKTEQDINFAAKVGVEAISADSMEELRRLAKVAEKLGHKIRVLLRVNPMFDVKDYSTRGLKYGIPINVVKKAIDFTIDNEYLELRGLHFHGSYINYPEVYFVAANKLLKLAKYCHDKGVELKTIDLGGGFPFEYNSKVVFKPSDMGKKFVKYFNKLLIKYDLNSPDLVFEPGKAIVGNAGIGLTKVICQKNLGKRGKYIVVDGSTYAFVPDPIVAHQYYDILPASNLKKPRAGSYTVAGCTCDNIDIIAKKRDLPRLEEGDLLTIMDCGAYSNVLASNFNTLKRAPMVLIKENGQMRLIRRRDRYSEMFAPELDVLKMADPKELKGLYNIYRINIDKLWRGSKKK